MDLVKTLQPRPGGWAAFKWDLQEPVTLLEQQPGLMVTDHLAGAGTGRRPAVGVVERNQVPSSWSRNSS